MGVGMITVLTIREPDVSLSFDSNRLSILHDPATWVKEAVVQPFVEFFTRNASQALTILLFIGIYRISDMVLGVMANPFYLETGFSGLQIFGYVKTVGLFAVIGGAALGGIAVGLDIDD